jgi:hypothetical protein
MPTPFVRAARFFPYRRWPFTSWLRRGLAWFKIAHEVFAEAQEMARAAHRRHPFIDW